MDDAINARFRVPARVRVRIRTVALAGVRALLLAVGSIAGSVPLFVLLLVSLALVPVLGIGLLTTPRVVSWVRAWADWRRLTAVRWGGVRIPPRYRVPAADAGRWARAFGVLRDPATWREFAWLPLDAVLGFLSALVPAALLLYPVEGFALALGLWRVFTDGTYVGWWYGFVPIGGQGSALAAGALGAVLLVASYHLTPALLRLHFLLTRALLGAGRGELRERVRVLTESRRDVVDTSAAELRRIERDLHDGAQARLIAMGMDLGTAEALIEKNPDKARELLARARRSSAEALAELRDLVHGIHPPVLAERGLGDAVRALALRLPVDTEVTVELEGGRVEAPVESAAYFAVSEVLTNAVKHSGAGRVGVDLRYADGSLRIAVFDDGRGGARVGGGSGLAGVERRIGTFDGVLAVSSPAGGPTMVTMEIPCELS
ncbi:sensor domain-containing protein [Streptomyces sp. SID12488]|uniref:sensor histidine kinase n=1 Tax=Streptomyces sp. SID12488 TaxID=2706040 RepID=UPI0013DA006D|nr:sensor domain-containing protein [Streptomyces sp. SID12488]NEA62116.1 sensor histidine kinase [Streptomyces sp. SID12488]